VGIVEELMEIWPNKVCDRYSLLTKNGEIPVVANGALLNINSAKDRSLDQLLCW